jgi:hypothetical protein
MAKIFRFEEFVNEGKTTERLSMSKVESILKEYNKTKGTKFSIDGAYGDYSLWYDGGHKLETGSLKDVLKKFHAVKFKYPKEEEKKD